MKNFLIFIFCVMTYILKGQDTTYLDNDWNKVSSPELSKYYKIDQRDKIDTNKAKVTIYYRSGQIKSENNYSVFKKGILDGKHKEWYENGQLHMDIDYKDGKYNG